MYFTDRGIEELDDRRGDEQVSIGWLAERLRDYVDEHPESEATIDGLASWLARLDDEDDEDDDQGAEPGESRGYRPGRGSADAGYSGASTQAGDRDEDADEPHADEPDADDLDADELDDFEAEDDDADDFDADDLDDEDDADDWDADDDSDADDDELA